jgi:thiamine-phosphate pyrophosphorylase
MLEFRLMAISDTALFSQSSDKLRSTIDHFRQLADAGLRAYQLREKSWTDRSRLMAAQTMSEAARARAITFLVNDRPDIASMVRATGVHLPEHGWPVPEARHFTGNGVVGKSCHSFAAALQAEQDGADYILFGPVYETESKKAFGAPLGLSMLRDVCASRSIPVFAVGGITATRAAECRTVGAHGVAVISALAPPHRIQTAVRDFELALGSL